MKILFFFLIVFGSILFIINIIFLEQDDEVDCGCFEWENSNAVIINNSVSVQRMVDENGNYYIMYGPDIEYEYIVNDIKYTGKNSPQYKTLNKEKSVVEKYLINYYVNKKIQIHYDKNYPETSYILNDDENKIKLKFYIVSIILCLTGIIGIIFNKKLRK